MASEALEAIARAEEEANAIRASARAEAAARLASAKEKLKEEVASFRAETDNKAQIALEEIAARGEAEKEKAAGEAAGYGVFLSDTAAGRFEKAVGIIVSRL